MYSNGAFGSLVSTRFFRLLAGLLGALFSTSFGQQVPVDKVMTFDVASVKASPAGGDQFRGRKGAPPFTSDPTRMAARHLTLKGLISRAYGIDESQVLGGPAWIDSDRYDIDAKVENPTDRGHMLIMLQALLSDRFRLRIHRDTKPIQQYVLAVAKNGPKFGPHFHPAETTPNAPSGNRPTAKDGLKAYTMPHLAFFLSDNRDWWDPEAAGGANPTPLPVLDQTGLTGTYDIVLNWTSRRDWLAAFEQDTGLKLELRRISSGVVVVDSATKPAPN